MSDPRAGGILVYTVHKAGSMFLHRLVRDVSREIGVPHYSIQGRNVPGLVRRIGREVNRRIVLPRWLSSRGKAADVYDTSWKQFLGEHSETACFGPIRVGEAEPVFPDQLNRYSIVLNVRDPRDVVTSSYYSAVYSHPRFREGFHLSNRKREEWAKRGIDQFVYLLIPEFVRRYSQLVDVLVAQNSATITYYEQMVTDFPLWLRAFLSAFDDVGVDRSGRFHDRGSPQGRSSLYRRMRDQYAGEFMSPGEGDLEHKRQMEPGDYLRKLKPETIATLNTEFARVLVALGYEV